MASTTMRSSKTLSKKEEPSFRAQSNLQESEEILRKLTESLGIKAAKPRIDVAKANPNDLLDYLIEKFHTLINQLKEEEKARLKAEYEVYELKRTLQKELLKQEETIKQSQEQIVKMQTENKGSGRDKLMPSALKQEDETKSETFKKLIDDIDRKESIIAALDQKLIRLSEELEKERQKVQVQAETLRKLSDEVAGKDNDMLLVNKRIEELMEKKNKMQKECSTLREEARTQAQAYAQLQRENEGLRQQYAKIQDDSRGKVDELRSSLKKNSALLKQVADLEKENKKLNELFNSQTERMNSLRNVNRQLESKTDNIKQKCEDLQFLQEKCAQLEAKCDGQAKLLQLAEIERMKASYPEGYEQEIAKKNLEVAKLTQELQEVRDEMRQLLERKTEGQDRLLAVGSVRKDKELRQIQGDYDLLKTDLARLKGENLALKSEIERRDEIAKHLELGERDRNASLEDRPCLSPEQNDEAVKEEEAPLPATAPHPHQQDSDRDKEGLGGSPGSGTLKSEMSELTKSQKLIIENMSDEQLLELKPQALNIEQAKNAYL